MNCRAPGAECVAAVTRPVSTQASKYCGGQDRGSIPKDGSSHHFSGPPDQAGAFDINASGGVSERAQQPILGARDASRNAKSDLGHAVVFRSASCR